MAQNIGPRIGIEGEGEYRRQLQNIIQTQKTLNSEMKMTESAFDKNASAQEKAAAKSKILEREVKTQEERLRQLTAMLKASEQAYGENDTRTLKWKAAVQDATTELNKLNDQLRANSKLKAFGDDMQAVGNKVSSAGDKITSFGTMATATVTAPIVAAGTAATKLAMDFETSMAKVSTIADTTQTPIGNLKKQIMDLSTETGMGASDIAEATYQALSAGQSTSEAVDFVANASKLAKAGFTDVTTSVDTLTTVLNAYGMESSETTHIMNNLITTQNLGKTTVGQLGQSLGTIIPTAAMFGVNLDQVSAAYVTLTKNGIGTAEATTYLNGILNDLGKSGTTSSNILKEKTGKTFKELMDSGMSLSDVVKIVQDGADEAGVSIADMFGNVRAAKAAGTLTQHANDFNSALQSMQSNAGATDEAFKKVANTTETKINKAINNLKNTGIEVGETVLPTVAKVAEQAGEEIKKAAQSFDKLSDSQKEMIIKAAGITAVLGPVVTVVGKATSAVGSLITTIGSGISAFAEAGGTLGLLVANIGTVAAVGGLAALAYATWKAGTYELTDAQKDLNKRIEETGSSIEQNQLSIDQLYASMSNSAKEIENSSTSLEYWRGQLNECYDASGHLKEGMEQTANYAMQQLNEAMGTDYTTEFVASSQNAVDALAQINASVDEYITKMKQQAIASAAMSDYTSALQEQQTALQQLTDAGNEYSEALKAQADARAKFNEENAKSLAGNGDVKALADAKRAWNETTQEVKSAAETLAQAGSQYESTTAAVEGLDAIQRDLAEGTAESIQKAQDAYANLPNAAQAAADGVKSANDVMKADTDSAIGQLQEKLGTPIVIPPYDTSEASKSLATESARAEKQLRVHGTVTSFEGAGAKGAQAYNEAQSQVGKGNTGSVRSITGGGAAGANAYRQAQTQTSRGNTGKVTQITGASSAASKARGEAQSWFNRNPVVMTIKQIVSKAASAVGITKHASGGFVDREQISWLAEGNKREVVIPLQAERARAIQLYRQAGRELGIRADYADMPMVGTSNSYDYGGINVNVYASQGQSESEIADAVINRIDSAIREKRGVFA